MTNMRFIRITQDDMVQSDAPWGDSLAGIGIHKHSVLYADVLPDGSAVYREVEGARIGNIIIMKEEFELC